MNTPTPTLRPAAMTLAWQLVKKTGLSLGAAIRKAWQAVRLKARLTTEKVTFRFIREDGTVRTAYGTRNTELIPEDCRPKGSGNASPLATTYFDLDLSQWRSFRADRLIAA